MDVAEKRKKIVQCQQMALPKWRKWVCTVSMDGFRSSLSSKVLNFLPTIWLINLSLEFFGMFFLWNWLMCIWNVEAFSLLNVYVVFESYVLLSVNAVAIYKINSAIKGCEQTLIQHTCQGKSLFSLFSSHKRSKCEPPIPYLENVFVFYVLIICVPQIPTSNNFIDVAEFSWYWYSE